jgi:hypothetical protein
MLMCQSCAQGPTTKHHNVVSGQTSSCNIINSINLHPTTWQHTFTGYGAHTCAKYIKKVVRPRRIMPIRYAAGRQAAALTGWAHGGLHLQSLLCKRTLQWHCTLHAEQVSKTHQVLAVTYREHDIIQHETSTREGGKVLPSLTAHLAAQTIANGVCYCCCALCQTR